MTAKPTLPATTAPAMPALPTPTSDDITAKMRAAGLIPLATGGADIHRVTLDAQRFIFGDKQEPDYIFDSPSNGAPAFRLQIVKDLITYHRAFFEEPLARFANRPSIADKYCKTYDDEPTQAGERAEDGTPCPTCPISWKLKRDTPLPYVEGLKQPLRKCGQAADLHLRVVDDNGDVSDERVWVLTLTWTGIVQWKGRYDDPVMGYQDVPYRNFKRLLAEYAVTNSDDPLAVTYATQSLHKGGVYAEARIVRGQSGANSFSIPVFSPIAIVPVEQVAQLDTEEQPTAPAEPDPADIPF